VSKPKLLLAVAVLALILPAPAAAHDKYVDVRYHQAAALENMIASWRSSRGLFSTVPTLATMTAVVAIQKANWQEAKFGKKISGDPFPIWSIPIFGNDPRGIIAGVRCHLADSWRPASAFRSFKSNPRSRAIMLLPFWSYMSVRSAVMHRHNGYYKGRGRCQAYWIVFAAPLLAHE